MKSVRDTDPQPHSAASDTSLRKCLAGLSDLGGNPAPDPLLMPQVAAYLIGG